MLLGTSGYMYPFESIFWYSLGKYLVVQLLEHMLILFLTFWGTATVFSRVAAPIFIPTSSARGFPFRGAWVAQSVERPTSAQVMISRSLSSNPTSGSVLTAQSLEPVSDSVSPSLSDLPPFMLCLSVSQKWINVKKKKSLFLGLPLSFFPPWSFALFLKFYM